MKRCVYKVPNGKLLKVFLDDVDGKISQLKITGDFFLYPEESVEKLEKELLGTPKEEAQLKTAINSFLEKNPTTLFGVDVDSLVYAIMNAA